MSFQFALNKISIEMNVQEAINFHSFKNKLCFEEIGMNQCRVIEGYIYRYIASFAHNEFHIHRFAQNDNGFARK